MHTQNINKSIRRHRTDGQDTKAMEKGEFSSECLMAAHHFYQNAQMAEIFFMTNARRRSPLVFIAVAQLIINRNRKCKNI